MIIQDNIFTLKTEHDIKWYEVDFLRILKPCALLNHLQDVATKSADRFGIGMSFLEPRNYAWFLIKYHLEFNDYPENCEKIVLKTESRGYLKLFAIRDFEIWSQDEQTLLGRASSQWAMINLTDKNFVKLSDIEKLPKFESREDDLVFSRINSLEHYDEELEFRVRYDDIDVNKHVNNANYLTWAFEALPLEFRKNHKPKTIDLVYKKEISYGNNVISKVKIENNKTSHLLENKETSETLCIVEVQWQGL